MTDIGFTYLFAQAAGQQGGAPAIWNMLPLFFIFGVLYFVLIRPQQKKAKELEEQVKTIKRGDKIVTNGGIVGVVISVKEKFVTIRSDDSKLEMLRSSIAEISERGNAAPEVKES